MPGQHNNGVEMFKILEQISTKKLDEMKCLNGFDSEALDRACSILFEKRFKDAECLEDAFPSIEKFRSFKSWADEYGPGTLELTSEMLNMIFSAKILEMTKRDQEFRHWEDKVNQRVWASYHWNYAKDPITQMDLGRHFVMVLKYPGMFDKLVAPPIGAPAQIWQKLLTI